LLLAPALAASTAVQPEPSPPTRLTLDEALRIFRPRGLDLLISGALRETTSAVHEDEGGGFVPVTYGLARGERIVTSDALFFGSKG
jgi:hypothetical protein